MALGRFTPTGIASWTDPTAAEAVIRIRWRNYHCRIAKVTGDVLTFARPCWTNASSGTDRTGPAWDTTVDSSRYKGVAYFENAIELLNTPGEFSWEPSTRTITYLPRPGEDLRRATTVTPSTEHLVVLDGARDINLSGLTFSYAAYHQPDTDEGYAGTQAGLTLTGASGSVDHAGRYYTKPSAALTVRGGRNVVVDGATFSRLGGAGAVRSPAPRSRRSPTRPPPICRPALSTSATPSRTRRPRSLANATSSPTTRSPGPVSSTPTRWASGPVMRPV